MSITDKKNTSLPQYQSHIKTLFYRPMNSLYTHSCDPEKSFAFFGSASNSKNLRGDLKLLCIKNVKKKSMKNKSIRRIYIPIMPKYFTKQWAKEKLLKVYKVDYNTKDIQLNMLTDDCPTPCPGLKWMGGYCAVCKKYLGSTTKCKCFTRSYVHIWLTSDEY